MFLSLLCLKSSSPPWALCWFSPALNLPVLKYRLYGGLGYFHRGLSLQLLLMHTTSTTSVSTATAVSNDPGNMLVAEAFSSMCPVCYPGDDFFLPIVSYTSKDLSIMPHSPLPSLLHPHPICHGLDYSGLQTLLLHITEGDVRVGRGKIGSCSFCWDIFGKAVLLSTV